jgi:outer membrane protein assembly factor BamD
VPYAYYLKAVSLYEQIADVNRDQRKTEEALAALQDLIQRYPNTEYARDARLKIDLARDHLAGKEMTVGRFYLRGGDPLAAIIRFRNVVDKYQTTSHTPEALERLTEAYLTLGIVNEAQTAAAVLGHNYPGSEWYQDAYNLLTNANVAPREDETSWISRAFNSIF